MTIILRLEIPGNGLGGRSLLIARTMSIGPLPVTGSPVKDCVPKRPQNAGDIENSGDLRNILSSEEPRDSLSLTNDSIEDFITRPFLSRTVTNFKQTARPAAVLRRQVMHTLLHQVAVGG